MYLKNALHSDPPAADLQLNSPSAVYILYDVIRGLDYKNPEAAFIVLGDFNRANMKKRPYSSDQTLDHCYKPLPRPALARQHCPILLLPAYRQRLKQDKTVSRVIYRWDSEAEGVLQACFETADWQIFENAADRNISKFIDSVIGYTGNKHAAFSPPCLLQMSSTNSALVLMQKT